MEKPILFSTEMVKAILENRKHVTRRIVKPHRKAVIENIWIDKEDGQVVVVYDDNYHIGEKGYIKPPYAVGNVLWVRETWQLLPSGFNEMPPEERYIYKATDELSNECTKWRPSIHMPRKAARLFPKVKSIRVERLRDITEEDAIAEGFISTAELTPDGSDYKGLYAREHFRELWDGIYKSQGYGWEQSPYVWVVEFEKA